MSQKEFERIVSLLNKRKVNYELIKHPPVYTSEQAAKARNAKLSEGVKAMVLKTKGNFFILALLSADKKIDLKKISGFIGKGKLTFASPQEVVDKVDCEIGSVSPLAQLPRFMDRSVLKQESVEFNIGLHTRSVRMKAKDLIKIIKPELCDFSK